MIDLLLIFLLIVSSEHSVLIKLNVLCCFRRILLYTSNMIFKTFRNFLRFQFYFSEMVIINIQWIRCGFL